MPGHQMHPNKVMEKERAVYMQTLKRKGSSENLRFSEPFP